MEYVKKIVENWFLPSWCSDSLVRYLHPCCLPEQDHSYLFYSSQTNTSLRGATREGTKRKTRSQPLIINDTTWKIHSRPNLNLKSVFFNSGIETYLFLYKTYRTWTSYWALMSCREKKQFSGWPPEDSTARQDVREISQRLHRTTVRLHVDMHSQLIGCYGMY